VRTDSDRPRASGRVVIELRGRRHSACLEDAPALSLSPQGTRVGGTALYEGATGEDVPGAAAGCRMPCSTQRIAEWAASSDLLNATLVTQPITPETPDRPQRVGSKSIASAEVFSGVMAISSAEAYFRPVPSRAAIYLAAGCEVAFEKTLHSVSYRTDTRVNSV
jgi:hypothetical protein